MDGPLLLSRMLDVALGTVARGDVLYRGASQWKNLAAGASGRVLTSNGAAADPSWQAIPAVDLSGVALLAGRAGGQTVNGGTAAGENLTLQSTAHATKGFIYLGGSSGYDGVNVRLGLGTQAPEDRLHVQSDGAVGGIISRASTDTSDATLTFRKARGTHASKAAIGTGDGMGDILFLGWDGTQWKESGVITCGVDGTVSTGVVSSRMRFYTTSPTGVETARLRIDALGNFNLNGAAMGDGSCSKCIFLPDAAVVPASNPAAGGYLYAEAGALKWRGSSGTITVLGAA